MIAGPSEILIVADGTCDPAVVAADMLSQAEHDKLASAVLVTDSAALAEAVSEELEKQIALLPRKEIARESIDKNGKIIITETISEAIAISNEIAPENLELCMDNPFDYLDEIKHAGSIFMGKNCPEALGDYFAGPNHTLPTSGTAKFSSPLSVDDFVKKTQYTYFTADALAAVFCEVKALAALNLVIIDADSVKGGRHIELRLGNRRLAYLVAKLLDELNAALVLSDTGEVYLLTCKNGGRLALAYYDASHKDRKGQNDQQKVF
jgi:histidinol dehydrogenase